MKRVFLAIIGGILLFLLGVSVAFRIVVPEEKSKTLEKYFIYMVDRENNDTDYSLEISSDRNINLTVNKKPDVPNGKIEQSNYEVQLSQADYAIVKKVIKYFEKAYEVGGKKEYEFYFDYETAEDRVYPDDRDIILNLVKGVEYVSLGNESDGDKSYKEIGRELLENIENEL